MPAVLFRDAIIKPYKVRQGFAWLAEWLILTSDLSNKEIATISGVSKQRVPPLRQQLRKTQGDYK